MRDEALLRNCQIGAVHPKHAVIRSLFHLELLGRIIEFKNVVSFVLNLINCWVRQSIKVYDL